MRSHLRRAAIAASCLAAILGNFGARADTLDRIRSAGHLDCAISRDLDDYSEFDVHGDISAFSADLCGAVAAAILGDPHKAAIHAHGDEISALREVAAGHDELMFGTTPDPALGLALHVGFGPAVLIDPEGFLVDARDHLATLADLKGRRVCYIDSSPAQQAVDERMAELGIAIARFPFSERGEMEGALATGHCEAIGGEFTLLANMRQGLKALRDHARLMDVTTGADVVAPAFAAGDARFRAIVDAVMFGLVEAETAGITRANARALAAGSHDPIQRRLLGAVPWMGRALGLDDHWLLDAIVAVGNQGEIFRRDLGAGSPLDLPVGANRPIADGGALIGLPVETPR